MFKKIYSGLIALLTFAQVQAQSPIIPPDSSYRKCGVTKELRDAMVVPAEPGSRFASALVPGYPSGATEVCGHFTLHYEDMRLGLLQGYNEPAGGLGVMRRNNLCQVIQYIESVLDFSLVPSGGINILVDRSDTYIGKGKGSVGLPFFSIPAGVHPTVDGFVNSFIRTGTDPAPGHFHGMIGIDFEPMLIGYYIVTPTNSDLSVTEACGIDLAAMELHQLSHVLGMFSFVDEDGSGMYKTISTPAVINDPFTSLDRAVHTTPDPETSIDPFLGSNLFPFVSSGFSFMPSSSATDRKFWLNGSQPPYNHGLEQANLNRGVWHYLGFSADNSIQSRLSPGDYQDYVTLRYEAFSSSPMRRQWTKGEREMFTTTMGYTYNPTYASAHATAIANHVPYSTKMGSNVYNHIYNSFEGPEKIPADFTITNDIGTSLIIDLTADGTLHDSDGHRISIFPGSLVNFRGCGQGGNNHNLLSVNGAGNEITYTPREDFYGRAQFGFNLFDGIEKGAFVTYTIDVRKGTNVAIPAGENIVLNGSFEEGSEVKVIGTLASETINNSAMLSPDHPGRLGYHFADSHPYESLKSAIGSVVINNTADNGMCLATNKTAFGAPQMTFPAPWWLPLVGTEMPNPPLVTEKRYRGMGNPGLLMYLGENMQQCKRYALEFYASRTCLGFAYPAKEQIKFGFTDDAHMQGSTFTGSSWAGKIENVDLVYSPTASTPAEHAFKKGEWQKVKISFTYCDTTAANILYLDVHDWWGPMVDPGLSPAPLILDSVSLKEVGFDVEIAITPAGGCDRTLVANPTEIASYGCTGTLFTWTDMSGTVLGTGKELTVSAMTLKSYIVIADDGCGHTAADTIEVAPCRCAPSEVLGTAAFTTLSGTVPTTVAPGFYYAATDLTVSGTTTFNNAVLLMEPAVAINVGNTAKLILDKTHIFTCPDTNQLWKGIDLASSGSSSGRIEVRNNSLIEDAEIAIKAESPRMPVSGDIISSINSVYNRNLTGIYINNFKSTATLNYPFTIAGNVFTARLFNGVSGYPNSWPNASALLTRGTVVNAQANDAVHQNYAKALCKNSIFSNAGISLNEVGITVGSSYYEILIGAASSAENNSLNLFDNQGFGIRMNNTNMTSYNNRFINISMLMEPVARGTATPYLYEASAGIFTYTSDVSLRDRLRVLPNAQQKANSFHDCFKGILTMNQAVVDIRSSEISSSHALGDMVVPGAAYTDQLYEGEGIRIEGNGNLSNVVLSSNKISNMNAGAFLYLNNPEAGATVAISSNVFSNSNRDPGYRGFTWPYMLQALQVFVPYDTRNATVNINANTFDSVYNAINVSGLWSTKATVQNNNITLFDKTMSTIGTPQYGIQMVDGYLATVKSNTITTPTLGIISQADYIKGVYAAMTKGITICSNTVNNIGRSFEFDQTTPQAWTVWANNTMQNAWKGFTLGSPIGDQVVIGGTNRPTGNQWLGGWSPTKPHTFVSISSTSSRLSVRAITLENPTFNGGPLTFAYTPSGSPTILYPSSSLYNCISGSILLSDNKDLTIKILRDDFGPDMPAANRWMAQYSLYKAAMADTLLQDSIPMVNTFINGAANSRYAWLANVEAALANGNTALALSLLSSPVSPMGRILVGNGPVVVNDVPDANSVVDNYLRYYGIYMHYLDSSLTGTDTAELEILALKCPALDGAIVYQARGLLRLLTGIVGEYNDQDCAVQGQYRVTPDATTEGGQQAYSLFPNPNQGSFTIRQNIVEDKTVRVKVFTAIGTQVHESYSTFKAGKLSLNISNPIPGLYLVCIDDEHGKNTCLRFIVK